MLLSDESNRIEGASYFDTATLKEVVRSLAPGWPIGAFSALLGTPGMSEATVERLQYMGFRRMLPLAAGSSSIIFRTVPDKQGREQLVVITPSDENRVPYPLLLPSIVCEKAEAGGKTLLLRVMPGLDVNPDHITDAHMQQISAMVRKSGLKAVKLQSKPEIEYKRNIGLYTYRNQSGEDVIVPMILDWGALALREGADLQALQEKWAAMPELEPWREACRHIAMQTHPENVASIAPGNKYSTLMQNPDSRLVKLLLNEGYYPQEIQAAGREALEKMRQGEIEPGQFIATIQAILASANRDELHGSVPPRT